MVPVRAGIDFVAATAASNWAGVRDGSTGLACAVLTSAPAVTAATAASTPPGTAHRVRRLNLGNETMYLTFGLLSD
jgi:hypothetical protein